MSTGITGLTAEEYKALLTQIEESGNIVLYESSVKLRATRGTRPDGSEIPQYGQLRVSIAKEPGLRVDMRIWFDDDGKLKASRWGLTIPPNELHRLGRGVLKAAEMLKFPDPDAWLGDLIKERP
jgi:hypothetical protein